MGVWIFSGTTQYRSPIPTRAERDWECSWVEPSSLLALLLFLALSQEMKDSNSFWLAVWKLITCRAKLLNADWLRQRAFFLNQEGTFGNQEGMITWSWLAEHACIKLVSRFQRSLKRNFRNALLPSWILTWSFHLNVKENQQATKHSLLVEKQKDFSDQNCSDSQHENSLSENSWCWTKH